jgi:hypothetical protein
MFGGSISALKLPMKQLINVHTQGKSIKFSGNEIMLIDIQFIGLRDINDFIQSINNPEPGSIYLSSNTNVKALFDSFPTKDNSIKSKTIKSKNSMNNKKDKISSKRKAIDDIDDTYEEEFMIPKNMNNKRAKYSSEELSSDLSQDCFDSIYNRYLGDDVYWYNVDYNDELQTFAGEYIYAGTGVTNMRRAPVITVYKIKDKITLTFLQVLSEANGQRLPIDSVNNYMVYRNMIKPFEAKNPSPYVCVVGNPTEYLKPISHYIFTKKGRIELVTGSVISSLTEYRDSVKGSNDVLSSDEIVKAIEDIKKY